MKAGLSRLITKGFVHEVQKNLYRIKPPGQKYLEVKRKKELKQKVQEAMAKRQDNLLRI